MNDDQSRGNRAENSAPASNISSANPALAALQRFYEAEEKYASSGRRDFAPVAATLHPQIVLHQPESLPYGGTWHGHQGFETWMKAFVETWLYVRLLGDHGSGIASHSQSRANADVPDHSHQRWSADRMAKLRMGYMDPQSRYSTHAQRLMMQYQ